MAHSDLHPEQPAKIYYHDGHVYVSGDWTKFNIPAIEKKIHHFKRNKKGKVTIDASHLQHLDSAGALVFLGLIHRIQKTWASVKIEGLSDSHQALIDLIESKEERLSHLPKEKHQESVFEAVGRATAGKLSEVGHYLAFLGQFTHMFFHSIRHFNKLQWRAFMNSIDEMGYRALPIIALLSFLIGVVLAYQLGIQLQNYGANAFIVNLIGQAVLREFGPLITAIIGAGRTSAALTAQLGSMKINEEIDALQTMGFSPFDILVIPRVMAALVVFPLLMIWADIFGVLGGMIMTKAFFGTQYGDFLGRFRDVVDVSTLFIGLSKAPAIALIVSMVGCFQGLNVSKGADSIGIQTTKSVVQSIFLIIIADAIYSIIYSKLNM